VPASSGARTRLPELEVPEAGGTHLDGTSFVIEPVAAAEVTRPSSASPRLFGWLLVGMALGVLVSLAYAALR
jgi:hypothetical protein